MAQTVRELSGVIFEFGEARLVNAAKLGDRDAAERLVELTYAAVYASLYRMCHGDADLAADLTQDTYRKAWEALAGFDGRSKLSTWLYRIAYTTFLNHVRRPDRNVELDEGSIEVNDPAPSIEDTIGKSEESSMLREAVLALPDELRYTVTAHYWGEVPIPEIARQEKITAVAIRKRLRKACMLLEAAMMESRQS
ncbi:MAG: RNA polymerase sigma factor [Acidobacteria bacterium]|nr:RNA polymerase sigma factor [Acidobacteriota bacterium]